MPILAHPLAPTQGPRGSAEENADGGGVGGVGSGVTAAHAPPGRYLLRRLAPEGKGESISAYYVTILFFSARRFEV